VASGAVGDADGIVLVPYSDAWPGGFIDEAAAIRAVLPAVAASWCMEHVGSTAVVGLTAKPILDLLLIAPKGSWPRTELVEAFASLGYVFWAANPAPDHLLFIKGLPPGGRGRTHHVHVRPMPTARPILAFRDALRASASLARAYAALKVTLAAAYAQDREAYTRGKDDFVARVLRAREACTLTPVADGNATEVL
jgi:GrpB-like predicted nucleotidyltransferase (UPF0157 family)